MSVEFAPYSAAITSLKSPSGKELALKFHNLDNYKQPLNPCFGASVGRVANRIWGAITVNGQKYELDVNQQPNITLHGGPGGWHKQTWQGPFETTRADGKKSTVFTILSPHLDNGFPGEVLAKAIYTPYTTEDGKFVLELEYEAEITENSPVDETVIAMTNHCYFNPSDKPGLEGVKFKSFSNQWIEKDANGVPTGELKPFPAIPEDLSWITFTKDEPKIDDCFAIQDLSDFKGMDTRSHTLRDCAHMYDPESKQHLVISSTEPVYQIYTGDMMKVPQYEGEPAGFPSRSGIAIEPARPTNAPLVDKWRPWVSLKKGDVYGSKTVFTTYVE
ncbi:hypothetical protein TRVA0_002S04368 [Trichomonascus vanleenenianus]|uniref:uncharacterized protein n=1 Tax=Trichomonascus vanleenenianus TaxID=2268995 RepID=UPI003ECA73CE